MYAQQPACVDTVFAGRDWCLTENAVVISNNVEFLNGLTREECVQACIDAVPPAKNYDCWSVEFITNGGAGLTCRTQSKTLFGSDTGYRRSGGTDLYERSCKYVQYLGVNK